VFAFWRPYLATVVALNAIIHCDVRALRYS
jgi:hypothetical protein